ncbi:MAG: hypothetical protein JWP11_1314 [Frankiales bacterium]|nr:hypothetical protein [Frankiales bacterium]
MSVQSLFQGDPQLVPAALRGYRTFALTPEGLSSTGVNHIWKLQDTAACANVVQYDRAKARMEGNGVECPCGCGRSYAMNDYVLGALGPEPDRHASPDAACACGFYGWYDPDDHRIVRADFFGVFEASGRVILGTHGFRAEKVKLLAIAPRTQGARERLRYLPRPVAEMLGLGLRLMGDVEDLVGLYPPQDMSSLITHHCDRSCYANVQKQMRDTQRGPTLMVSSSSFAYNSAALAAAFDRMSAQLVAAMTAQLGWAEANPALKASAAPTPFTQQYAQPIGPLTRRQALLAAKAMDYNKGPASPPRWWRR